MQHSMPNDAKISSGKRAQRSISAGCSFKIRKYDARGLLGLDTSQARPARGVVLRASSGLPFEATSIAQSGCTHVDRTAATVANHGLVHVSIISATSLGPEATKDVLRNAQYMTLKQSFDNMLTSSTERHIMVTGLTSLARRCAHAVAGRLQWKHVSSDIPWMGRVITFSSPAAVAEIMNDVATADSPPESSGSFTCRADGPRGEGQAVMEQPAGVNIDDAKSQGEHFGNALKLPAPGTPPWREPTAIVAVDSSPDSSGSCVFRADLEEAKLQQAKAQA